MHTKNPGEHDQGRPPRDCVLAMDLNFPIDRPAGRENHRPHTCPGCGVRCSFLAGYCSYDCEMTHTYQLTMARERDR